MKKKAVSASPALSGSSMSPASRSVAAEHGSWLDYFIPLLPLVALIPNFFIPPSLSMQGLATQEVGFAVAVLLCAALGLWRTKSVAASGDSFLISRTTLWVFVPFAAFIGWLVLSLLWATERGEVWRQLGFWVGFLIFLSALWNGVRSRAAWWCVYTLMAFAFVLALSLWLEYRAYGPANMLGTFFNHGLTAELLAMMFPLFFCVFLFEKNHQATWIASAVMTLICLGALSLTLRRAPLLGVVVSFAFIMIALLLRWMKAADRRRVIVVVLVVLVFGLPVIIIKREAILTRLRGATELQVAEGDGAADIGLTARATSWLTAVEMGKANLLKGVGLGNYPTRYATYRRSFIENPSYAGVVAAAETEDYDEVRSPLAHSEYLQMFAELGVVGITLFALFCLGLMCFLWQARHTRRGYLLFGVLCSLVAFGVSISMSAFAFRYTPGILTLACLLAIACAAVADEVEENAAPVALALPRNAALGLWALAILASLFFVARNYRVYESQRTQGSSRMETQLDFTFALDNEPVNEASVRRYERVLASDPYNAGAHLGLAVLLFQMKRLPECLQHADYAFQHGYNRPFTYLLRAFAHEHNASSDQAQSVLREGIASFPKSVILRMAYAELSRKRGRTEEVAAQQAELEKQKIHPAFIKSWALAMRYKDEEATRLARQNGLYPPGELRPTLARVLAQARAYHYLRDVAAPAATPTPAP